MSQFFNEQISYFCTLSENQLKSVLFVFCCITLFNLLSCALFDFFDHCAMIRYKKRKSNSSDT